jgi:hypothetical protein
MLLLSFIEFSSAPFGLCYSPLQGTQGLRPGLHSVAALRLKTPH